MRPTTTPTKDAAMTTIATLMNWDDESRRAGTAWIRVRGTVADDVAESVTVAKGQSAKAALEAAGWTITSGVRRHHGQIMFLVERARPGLRDAANRLSALVAVAGLA